MIIHSLPKTSVRDLSYLLVHSWNSILRTGITRKKIPL